MALSGLIVYLPESKPFVATLPGIPSNNPDAFNLEVCQ